MTLNMESIKKAVAIPEKPIKLSPIVPMRIMQHPKEQQIDSKRLEQGLFYPSL